MVDAGIFDGDIAIIERCENVESKEIAAVIIDEEATLKRVLRSNDGVILRAANRAFPDIVIHADSGSSVRIAGRYVGLIRSANLREGLVA